MEPTTSLATAVALLEALDRDELFLAYQGVYDLSSGRLHAVEALVRWRHPSRGVLGPAAFLPPDMDGGVGGALTNWVVERAVSDCAAWRRDGGSAAVSVNVSPGCLGDVLLADRLGELFDRYSLHPAALTVEVTEQRCKLGDTTLRPGLVALSRLGVALSLDDFGMGESSLSRLQQLHFDEIKIDRSFVADLATNPTDRHIVRFATELAHNLGMRVVAEGIESAAALAALRGMGVDAGQGFLLHVPGDLPVMRGALAI